MEEQPDAAIDKRAARGERRAQPAVTPQQPVLTQTEEEVVTPQPQQQRAATEPGEAMSLEEVLGGRS